ncbi:MAG: exonuclease SbcCD subunit D [Candidatus Hodarchaeota archaeon]
MAKILFVSDVHIGIRYSYQLDFRTGISQRTLDFIQALERVVDYAIEEKIDIFVICGDLYDRVTIGPTLLHQVREKIWQKLLVNHIPIVLIGGNHDSPQIIEKGAPFGEISIIPNSIAVRSPESSKIRAAHTKEEVGFILLPYMTASQIVEYVENLLGEEIERDQYLNRSQELIQEWIRRQVKSLDSKVKIIIGHFYFQGSKIGIIPYPDQLPHEFVFKKDMLPLDEIDLAVFGHIHTTQVIYDKVLIPGSLERVDFGESEEDKGFYIYDTDTKNLSFQSNKPRSLVKWSLEVPRDTENPTKFILNHLPQNIENSIVRIEIKISSHLKKQIISPKIHKPLEEKTFHYELIWDTSEITRDTILPKIILDPRILFSEYVKERCRDFPYQKELKSKGLEILDEALLKIEESK